MQEAWRAATLSSLVERADANSLATAAVLSYPGKAPAQVWAERASQLAPESPAIGWLRVQICANTAGCDIREAATAMRWIDADNGAAWLPMLTVARKDRDTMEVDRILAHMAQGARFDLYWNQLVALMFDSLNASRRTAHGDYLAADWKRLNFVLGLAGAELIPAFSPLIDVCREPAASTERHEACLKISKIMQSSDTILAQMAGLNMERRLVPADSKEARAILERRRTLTWRMTMAAQVESPMLPWSKNARARRRLSRMRAMPREEDVCIAILQDHNLVIDPP